MLAKEVGELLMSWVPTHIKQVRTEIAEPDEQALVSL